MTDEKALTPLEQKTVLFYGDELTAVLVEHNGRQQVYIPIRPISDFLGIGWSSQRKRILRDPVLSQEIITCVVITTTQGQPDQRRDMQCLPLDLVNGFLFGISADRVKLEMRDRVIRYQRECYRILADAFLERNPPSDVSQADVSSAYASLARVREMALAIAELASQQMEFERRMTSTESRLDRAAQVVGDIDKRLKAVERRTAPGQPISEEQAAEVSQQVKALAMLLSEKKGGEVHYQAIWGELYRQFGVTSYKLIPQSKYEAVLAFLAEWHGRAAD